jgi:hypothetical protein
VRATLVQVVSGPMQEKHSGDLPFQWGMLIDHWLRGGEIGPSARKLVAPCRAVPSSKTKPCR